VIRPAALAHACIPTALAGAADPTAGSGLFFDAQPTLGAWFRHPALPAGAEAALAPLAALAGADWAARSLLTAPLAALSSAALIGGLLQPSPLQRLFSHNWPVAIGQRAYGF